ncbi:hypothetical protein JCM10212_000836 [Sporobolomyces blumeae]
MGSSKAKKKRPSGSKPKTSLGPSHTRGRPACSHCLKASALQGVPPMGVRCLYSAQSVFAKAEDVEAERKLGGRADRCIWSKGEGGEGEGETGGDGGQSTNAAEDEPASESSNADPAANPTSPGSTFSPSSSFSTLDSASWSSPVSSPSTTPSSPPPCPSPVKKVADEEDDEIEVDVPTTTLPISRDDEEIDELESEDDHVPEVDWDAIESPKPVSSATRSPSTYSPRSPLPASPASPPLSWSPRLGNASLPVAPLALFDTPTCPTNDHDAAFWDYGPISKAELND